MKHGSKQRRLKDAVRHFETGRSAEAERICRSILAEYPAAMDVLNLLASVLRQRGDDRGAIAIAEKVLERAPNDLQALRTLGRALHACKDFGAAVSVFERGCTLRRNDAELFGMLAVSLHAARRFDQAEAACRRAVDLQPSVVGYHLTLGAVLVGAGRLEEAVAAYRQALALHPNVGELHAGLGAALMELKEFDEAVAAYGNAVAINPNRTNDWLAEANQKMALALRTQGQHGAAASALELSISLRPDCPDAHSNLGLILKEMGRSEDAIRCCRRAIELDPRHATAYSNLGMALHERDESEAAVEALQTAIALAPDHVPALNNLGNALYSLGRIDESLVVLDRAVACDPTYAAARYNRSLLILLKGDLSTGFAEYEYRRRGGISNYPPKDFTQPEWQGEPLAGRTILLYAEQGLGDTIQFARFATSVQSLGADVILQVQRPLVSLLEASFPNVRVVSKGEPLPRFDCHFPLMSLPWRLGTALDSIPAEVPYLRCDPAKLAAWRDRIGAYPGIKVGVVWAGSAKTKHDRQRSLSARTLLQHLPTDGITLFSLQKETRPGDASVLAEHGDRIVDLAPSLENFTDTAAAAMALDLVISIDSAVAHLAGGLARPTWVLLPHALDWRWLCDRADSPWYPTLRLIRQPRVGDWQSVLSEAATALRDLAASNVSSSASPDKERIRLDAFGGQSIASAA